MKHLAWACSAIVLTMGATVIFSGKKLPEAIYREHLPRTIYCHGMIGGSGSTALIDAIRAKHHTLIYILTRSVDVNEGDHCEQTPLMHMIDIAEDSAYVDHLIAAGADVNARDQTKVTALMYAAQKNDTHNLTALLRAGAEPNACDAYGQTPLIIATKNNQSINVIQLARFGANLNVHSHSGWTALMLSLWFKQAATARILAQRGAHKLTQQQLAELAKSNIDTHNTEHFYLSTLSPLIQRRHVVINHCLKPMLPTVLIWLIKTFEGSITATSKW